MLVHGNDHTGIMCQKKTAMDINTYLPEAFPRAKHEPGNNQTTSILPEAFFGIGIGGREWVTDSRPNWVQGTWYRIARAEGIPLKKKHHAKT